MLTKKQRAKQIYHARLRKALEEDNWSGDIRPKISHPKLLKVLHAIAFMDVKTIPEVVEDLLLKKLKEDQKWKLFFSSGYDLSLSTVINVGRTHGAPHENLAKQKMGIKDDN